ncbi:OmpA family protein [Sulfurospirillum sp. 1307]|jgi:outer membrane protein OmpA-like peptidoglycan-associated protein
MEVAVIGTWIVMLVASLLNSEPKTTVVLVDNNKDHNAIVVQTKAGSVEIDKVGGYVSLDSKDKAPSEIKIMSKDEINKKFDSVIKAAALPPVEVNLYFKNNSNELTDESKSRLPEILDMIQKRSPCDVNIIGHTDTKGSSSFNEKLALKRAKYVKDWILSSGVKLNNLKAESYGENDLLVPTADDVSEPKNRRVEIFIK